MTPAPAPRPDERTDSDRIVQMEERQRWHGWLLAALCAATFGEYLGLNGAVAEAVARHLP